MSGRPFSAKQWFAIKSKLQREGKWDEKRHLHSRGDVDATTKSEPKGKKRVGHKPQSNTLDNYVTEEQVQFKEVTGAEAQEVNDIISQFENEGKHILMSKYGGEANCDLFIEDSSDSCRSDPGKIDESDKNYTKNVVENESLYAEEELPDSPISFFHEGRDLPRETWEIERAFRNIEVSPGTRERIRTVGIPEITGTIRDNCVIISRVGQAKFFDEIKNDPEYRSDNPEFYESYFQTFNSIAVVIRCLPDDQVTTHDLYNKIDDKIEEPFIIVCEKSEEGVMHWHMIWFTSKRSDNAKRLLQKSLVGVPGNISISCQQTRSCKHLIRYILKNPITIGVGYSDALMKYTFDVMKELEEKGTNSEKGITSANLGEFPNQMIKDIINVMNENKVYNFDELVNVAPEVMQKYLHKPNLESIIHNCKMFLHRPNDTLLVFERITTSIPALNFFPIWFFLSHQGINAGDFILDLWNVLFKTSYKKNVFCIKGPSNTGKTAFIREFVGLFNWAEVVQGGQFMFQNCVNKEVLVWEEPLIGPDYVEMCKRVFEGMTTMVNIKFKSPQKLYRTPIIMTTNKDVWHYCEADKPAFLNRMFLYDFNLSIPSTPYSSRDIRKYWGEYHSWLTNLSFYFSGCEQNCTGGPEFSESENLSNDCGIHREFYLCSGYDNCLPSTADGNTTGIDDRERPSGGRSKKLKRTERSGSPIDDCTTVDDCSDRAGTSAGDTRRRRSYSEGGLKVYSGDGERSYCKLGGDQRTIATADDCSRRSVDDIRSIRECIQKLCDYRGRYAALTQVRRKGKLPKEPELDRKTADSSLDAELFKPATKEHWLSLIYLGLLLCKKEKLL